MADKVIEECQSAFIKGRNILEGVVIVHETIHKLRRSKKQGLLLKIDFEKTYDKVRWSFLKEAMTAKGYPERWIKWVMQTVQGGQVCVNVNGQRSSYFKTYQGLRQGDPLSPTLFNTVAEVLGVMMNKARHKGIVSGLMDHLIPGGVTHVQYADDTMIMTDCSESSVLNLKIILYCFEWLSGLKINFHKSELFVFGPDQTTKEKYANMLNCKLGALPIKYLGIPIDDQCLGLAAFVPLVQKLHKRLDPWKGKNMSSGGRLVLSNTCLSRLPMYTMGFYLLRAGTHEKMDSIRSKFFWRGAQDKFRYHMVKWETACRPKDQGGLGIIDTHIMNQCLMVKWIWKILKNEEALWCRLLKAKYTKDGDFFSSKSKGSSQFWQGLHKVKHMFHWGPSIRCTVGKRPDFGLTLGCKTPPLKFNSPSYST